MSDVALNADERRDVEAAATVPDKERVRPTVASLRADHAAIRCAETRDAFHFNLVFWTLFHVRTFLSVCYKLAGVVLASVSAFSMWKGRGCRTDPMLPWCFIAIGGCELVGTIAHLIAKMFNPDSLAHSFFRTIAMTRGISVWYCNILYPLIYIRWDWLHWHPLVRIPVKQWSTLICRASARRKITWILNFIGWLSVQYCILLCYQEARRNEVEIWCSHIIHQSAVFVQVTSKAGVSSYVIVIVSLLIFFIVLAIHFLCSAVKMWYETKIAKRTETITKLGRLAIHLLAKETDGGEEADCPVCLCPLLEEGCGRGVRLRECGHPIHDECLLMLCSKSRHRCPTCDGLFTAGTHFRPLPRRSSMRVNKSKTTHTVSFSMPGCETVKTIEIPAADADKLLPLLRLAWRCGLVASIHNGQVTWTELAENGTDIPSYLSERGIDESNAEELAKVLRRL